MGKRVWLAALGLSLTLIAVGCRPSRPSMAQSGETGRQSIVVYAFSVEEEALTEKVFPAFQAHWREQTGEEVIFQSVFGSSEELTQEILDGASADVAILANEQHAIWLRINDWVQTDWQTFSYHGVISCSPLAIAVRPGNPLGIEDWADLARPGVDVVHPDPRTSGGAQWALLAEYGSALLHTKNGRQETAEEQLRSIWSNVVDNPTSAREALKQFVFGVGDALATYEQDALLAQARGAALEVIIPHSTIMSEHVVVIVDRNVKPWEQKVVKAFVNFLWSEAVQETFTRYYFRAVTDEALNQAVPEFREVEHPFTVHDLGGWGYAYPEIIHRLWKEQILAE
jgi:sulfate/thiosulfate-binding protein